MTVTTEPSDYIKNIMSMSTEELLISNIAYQAGLVGVIQYARQQVTMGKFHEDVLIFADAIERHLNNMKNYSPHIIDGNSPLK